MAHGHATTDQSDPRAPVYMGLPAAQFLLRRFWVAIAAHLKRTTQAGNGWLAEHLGVGKPGSFSFYVSRVRRAGGREQIQQAIQKLER